jgi:hypothetical protein
VLLYDSADLERYRSKNEKVKIHVIGVVNLAADIDPDLARQVIESIKVRGVFNASQAVKDALADRMR